MLTLIRLGITSSHDTMPKDLEDAFVPLENVLLKVLENWIKYKEAKTASVTVSRADFKKDAEGCVRDILQSLTLFRVRTMDMLHDNFDAHFQNNTRLKRRYTVAWIFMLFARARIITMRNSIECLKFFSDRSLQKALPA